MAKRRGQDPTTTTPDDGKAPGGETVLTVAEAKIEEFAADLGRLLGTARAKAEGWIGQRQTITQHLQDIRDTATQLLTQLTGAPAVKKRGRPARSAASAGQGELQPAPPSKKQRRKMSAKARAAISAAQKARWANYRREQA